MAKLCRRLCGETSGSPALCAAVVIILWPLCLVSRPPRAVRNNALASRPGAAAGSQVGTRPSQVGVHRLQSGIADGEDAFLVPLASHQQRRGQLVGAVAADMVRNVSAHIEVVEVEVTDLTDPRPGRVQQLHDRPVAQLQRARRRTVRAGLDHGHNLVDGRRLGKIASPRCQRDIRHHVRQATVRGSEAVQAPDGTENPGDGGLGQRRPPRSRGGLCAGP